MHIPTLINYVVVAWGIPIGIVLVVRVFTPDSDRNRTDFSRQTFAPSRVWVAEKKGIKGSDYFELRLENPEGEVFFHRDPDSAPILELQRRFPTNEEVSVLYCSSETEPRQLMEITAGNASILSFDDVMAKYADRRRVLYLVAAVWFALANLLSLALWKVDISKPVMDREPAQKF